jgi:UDP-N-acetylmuramoyl-tripeptide--D-alanyl-D-alanine ligase
MITATKPAAALAPLWTVETISEAINGHCSGPNASIFGLAIDSREVREGDAFFAMPGTAMDGHEFAQMALGKGAAVVIARADWQAPGGIDEGRLIRCDCPKQALIDLGVARRAQTAAKIIGVTGSVGKTSLKDALLRCLGREALAHTNVRSFNNDVGVPLTMARMPLETQFGIFEMGMNHAGELTQLSGWVRPNVALITTIALAHYAYFDSEEDIADAKAEIFKGLEPGGTAILPRDNRHFERLKAAAEACGAARILTFGTTSDADVHPITVSRHGHCTTLTVKVGDQTLMLKVGIPGAHWVINAVACIAAVYALEGDLGLAGLSLAEMRALPGRGAISQVPVGAGEALVMDDSYNANPASVKAALETFGSLELDGRGRRCAVLADMLELGDDAPALHADLLPAVLGADIDTLICVGPLMAHLAKVAESQLSVLTVDTHLEALKQLKSHVRAGDAILVKGSNSMKLGTLVAELKDGALALSDLRPTSSGGEG